MDTQRQSHFGKRPLSVASKRPDAFWSLIVPSARLERGRLDATTVPPLAHPQSHHSEDLRDTQGMDPDERGTLSFVTRANGTDLYHNFDVTHEDTEPMKRRARRRPEPSDRAQPVRPYISLAEQLKRTQRADSDKHADDTGLSEGKILAPTTALCKGENGREAFESPDDGSDGDEEHHEDVDAGDSETASSFPKPVTQQPQLSYGTSRRASVTSRRSWGQSLTAPSEAIAPKRKAAPSQPSTVMGRRPRKKIRYVVERSDEYFDENSDKEEYKEYTPTGRVRRKVNRPAKAGAQGSNHSRKHQRWTIKEEETLFRLRNQGESWEYIGESVLGRTEAGVRNRWDIMRTESLKSAETRAKMHRRVHGSAIVSAMARIPRKTKGWLKEEDETMIRLRAQGKTLRYVWKRIPGKTYGAVKGHWLKIKDRYPQTAAASKDLESNGMGTPSDRHDVQSSPTSQLDQEAEEALLNSRPAIIECIDLTSSLDGDSDVVAGVDVSSAKQPYEMAVAVNVGLAPATAGNNPKFKNISTDHHYQQGLKPLLDHEDSHQSTTDSAYTDEPNSQPIIARRESQDQEKAVISGRLIDWVCMQGMQKPGTHGRSHSWS